MTKKFLLLIAILWVIGFFACQGWREATSTKPTQEIPDSYERWTR